MQVQVPLMLSPATLPLLLGSPSRDTISQATANNIQVTASATCCRARTGSSGGNDVVRRGAPNLTWLTGSANRRTERIPVVIRILQVARGEAVSRVWVQVRVRVRVRMWMSAVCMVQVRAYALLVVDRRGKVAWDGQDKDGSAAGLQDGVSRGKECAEDAGLDACIGSNEIIARFSSKGREIVGRGCELNTVQVVKWVDPSVRTAPGSYLFASNVKTS